VASLLNADRGTDGRSTPESTSVPAGSGDSNGEDGVNDDEDGSDAPGNPPMTGIPTKGQGKYVQVDESVFIGRPADFAAESLEKAGLVPTVTNQFDEPPEDVNRCVVSDVDPNGRVPVNTEVVVRCEEDGEPPR
jgi:serine/threonine-protein kinase